MDLKITFDHKTAAKTLCLGVYENIEFLAPTKAWDDNLQGLLSQAIQNSKFQGRLFQHLSLFSPEGMRLILVGLGKKENQNEQQWQKIGGFLSGVLEASPNGEGSVEVYGFEGFQDEQVISNLAFGALLRGWRFEKYFTTKKPEELYSLKKITFFTPNPEKTENAFKPFSTLAESIFLTRTLVTEPANVITPETLAQKVEALKENGLKITVLREAELDKLGMHALLGVGQGSIKESSLAIIEWNGGKPGEAPLAFIGKGVTFDTGGISIKPAANMEEMKHDMAGAGVVIGLMKALALRKAKVNVVGVVGLVENMPSGSAQRPGDVVKSLSGQTIEIINTDAEGRLVLADALWYTQDRFKPQCMIDLATLTGAIVISLGSERAGLFASNKELSDKIVQAGETVGELVWPMPMDDVYDKEINSDIADMKNSTGRGASSVTAAKFLQRFTNNVPWAHLDIAGVAWTSKDLSLCAKGATAFGIRLLNQFVSTYEKE